MESARHVAVGEAVLPLEFLLEQRQRQQFVLTPVEKVVAMMSTYVEMQFAEDQQHFDALIVDEALHLPELEAGLLFVLLGRKVCHHRPYLEPRRAPRRRPQRRIRPENRVRKVALLSALRFGLSHLSEHFTHFILSFVLFSAFLVFCFVS